jgi:hypothetical protein
VKVDFRDTSSENIGKKYPNTFNGRRKLFAECRRYGVGVPDRITKKQRTFISVSPLVAVLWSIFCDNFYVAVIGTPLLFIYLSLVLAIAIKSDKSVYDEVYQRLEEKKKSE